MTWTWVEPFAGAAACSLRLVGGRDLAPPVAWMGGKRRLAMAILGAMGVPEGRPGRVVLCDAGPWGWVWPLLLNPESVQWVAAHLREWASEHPRALWERLAAQPPAEDLHERAAQWLWLQARTASGVPAWWGAWAPQDEPGWRMGEEFKKSRRGTRTIAQNGNVGRWLMGNQGHAQPINQRGRPQNLEEWTGRTGGMVNPGTIADRVEAIAHAFAGVRVDVRHGEAESLSPPGGWGCWCNGFSDGRHVPTCDEFRAGVARGAFVYLDPPYEGATGYGWDCARAEVLVLARRWAAAGAVVAVSEAVPLELHGWHHLELTRPGGKPEWLTVSRAPVRVPERQLALFGERP